MKHLGVKALSTLCLCATALPLLAERYPYERYTNIVERQMFGPLPPNFDPTKPPSEVQKTSSKEQKELTKEQEKLKSAIRFSMINVNPAGDTMVGFSDSSNPKMVKHYYLKVGETKDGWTVESADPLKAKMTIVKGELSLDLSLGANSANDGGKDPRQGASPSAPQTSAGGRRQFPSMGINGARPAGGNSPLTSLRERRMARQQQMAAAQKAADEEKAKREAAAEEKEKAAEEEKARMQQKISELVEQRRLDREEQKRKEQEAAEKKSAAAPETTEGEKKESADSDAQSDE